MIKIINLMLVTAGVCFALFAFMASLVAPQESKVITSSEFELVEFVEQAKDSKVIVRQQLKPLPEPKIVDIKPTTLSASTTDTVMVNINVPGPNITGTDLIDMNSHGMGTGEARPIVRVSPKYPLDAQRDGKEGWVQLAFSILANGSVGDVAVIAAEPKRVFNKEAVRALKKWKYKPKVIDGKPMKQLGMSIMLEFKMDQSNS